MYTNINLNMSNDFQNVLHKFPKVLIRGICLTIKSILMTFTMCYSGVILQEEIIAKSLLGVKK